MNSNNEEWQLSPADSIDFRGKDLESQKMFSDAARERYRAAELYEKEGNPRNAMLSYNRAAKDAHIALYNLERYYRGADKPARVEAARRLNMKANMKAGELYLEEGDIVEAAYCFSYAACGAAKLELPSNLAIELARKAMDLFSEGKTEPVPAELREMLPKILSGL